MKDKYASCDKFWNGKPMVEFDAWDPTNYLADKIDFERLLGEDEEE